MYLDSDDLFEEDLTELHNHVNAIDRMLEDVIR